MNRCLVPIKNPIEKAIEMLEALNEGERIILKSEHELGLDLEDNVVFVATNLNSGKEIALNFDLSLNAFIQECMTARIRED